MIQRSVKFTMGSFHSNGCDIFTLNGNTRNYKKYSYTNYISRIVLFLKYTMDTLSFQYKFSSKIFLSTEKIKDEVV